MNRNAAIDIGQRLRDDAKAKPYRDNVWPHVIQFYRPFVYDHDDPALHYRHRVLLGDHDELDRHFDIGLFGHMRNGLSVVLLALAKMEDKNTARNIPAVAGSNNKRARKSSADAGDAVVVGSVSEEVRKLLCNYIACIALQFWLMIHRQCHRCIAVIASLLFPWLIFHRCVY